MINAKIANKQGTTLAKWESDTAPYVTGDVINLDPGQANPREMTVVERQWHATDQLVLVVSGAPSE